MKKIYQTATILACILTCHFASANPTIIDDRSLYTNYEKKMQVLVDEGLTPKIEELKASLEKLPTTVDSSKLTKLATSSPENREDSVFIISSVFDCGKCDRWHMGSVATAWALSNDGLMVTNHHVFAGAYGEIMGVSDVHGNIYPVIEILAGNKNADICIFRVKGEGFKPLALAAVEKTAPLGTDVHLIAHPNKRFFTHTFGKVSRYFQLRKSKDFGASKWMSITADFAKGSSGGPVMNKEGEVLGIVAFTNSIYHESSPNSKSKDKSKALQMVVKSCVPVAAIHELLGNSAE
ncbi:serine protease [Akkermansiaceae bacterium]|nr:serine protease [Akkermansiaceae bacterium]